METESPNEFETMSSKESFSHDQMAELIMEKFEFLTYADTQEVLYYDKDDGIFKPNGQAVIQKHVEIEMANLEGNSWSFECCHDTALCKSCHQ